MLKRKRAAHLLLSEDLVYSPPNEAIITALLSMDYAVDLFAPRCQGDAQYYDGRVRMRPIEYSKRWFIRNIWSPEWRKYHVFSGTSEDPLALVGLLSFIWRRPSFVLVDEIKSGSYSGDSPRHWKQLCRWAMRRARFCIVNDEARVDLLREYAAFNEENEVIVYPGCYFQPPKPLDRGEVRTKWRMPKDSLVVGISGGFNETSGAEWLFKAFSQIEAMHLVVQPLNISPFARILIEHIASSGGLYVESDRLGWHEAWSMAAAFDIGIAIYFNNAPQFQKMGVSSNRLCMFLAMGVPVVVSRQKSFEFIERYDCGVMVGSEDEFVAAIGRIAERLDTMKENALRCAREYIDAQGRYHELKQHIATLS